MATRDNLLSLDLRARIASGDLDAQFVNFARKQTRLAVRNKDGPSGPQWNPDEIDELVFETIERVTHNGVIAAANGAENEARLGAWLRQAVKTQLLLRARETPIGTVLRAIDAALAEDSAFEQVGSRWRLRGDAATDVWHGNCAVLTQVAWSVPTRTIRRDPMAERTQMAWRDDTRAVCRAVLEVSGPIEKVDLGSIVAERFNTHYINDAQYLDDDDLRSLDDELSVADSDEGDVREEALWMLSQLDLQEQLVIHLVLQDASVRDIGKALACGKTKATEIKERVVEKLRLLSGAVTDDAQPTMEELLRLIGHAQETGHLPAAGTD